jgi:hypothetical protein
MVVTVRKLTLASMLAVLLPFASLQAAVIASVDRSNVELN